MISSELEAQLARLHPESFGWALSCCGQDEMEAEDVLQSTYLKVVSGKARFEGRVASVKNTEVNDVDAGTIKFNGGALSLGGGLSVYLRENLAPDAGLKASFGTFNEIEIGALSIRDPDIEATSTRFKVGIVWWP